jgi:formylglycine-generating enzyme required for sulfatase activity
LARLTALLCLAGACAHRPTGLLVPAGPYQAGSTAEEREQAYRDAERGSGDDRARRGRWFDRAEPRPAARLPAFTLDRTPVTQDAYAAFLRATGGSGPVIDEAAWSRQGFRQPYEVVRRYLWRGATPPPGRGDHPVVLVTQAEAAAYCRWAGGRLPSAAELEKAARGREGRSYPWGGAYEASRLNGLDGGPGDTVSVRAHPGGAGPYGHLDLAGNVFQWTSTPWGPGGYVVKGSAWDDHAGVGRGAQRHGRPAGARHVLVGFRCADR